MNLVRLRRVIQRDIEDIISEKILLNEISDGERIEVDAEGEGLLGEFTFKSQQFDVAELDESSKDSNDDAENNSAEDSDNNHESSAGNSDENEAAESGSEGNTGNNA